MIENRTSGETTQKNGYHHLASEDTSPTQTHGLVTTVPQNIAGSNLGNQHTPTRNSLRHSRMVVLNKTSRVPMEDLPAIVRYHDRAHTIVFIILIVGIIMSFECSSLKIYAPNTKVELNPFYCTIPILFSGILGLVYLRCCRKEYPGIRRNACEKAVKVLSISTSIIATVTSFLYVYNILLHIFSFVYLECKPPDLLQPTCFCRLKDNYTVTPILNNNWDYVDLSCFELFYIFNSIVSFTAFASVAIVVFEMYYLSLHWFSRSKFQSSIKDYSFI